MRIISAKNWVILSFLMSILFLTLSIVLVCAANSKIAFINTSMVLEQNESMIHIKNNALKQDEFLKEREQRFSDSLMSS